MAILKNGLELSGKMGDMKFSRVGNTTVVSLRPTQMRDAKSEKQLRQRLKINNILNAYKLLGPYLGGNFEEATGTRRACHIFRGANLMLPQHAWLSPSERQGCSMVLAPMVVSAGTLPSVEYAFEEGDFLTNIEVGDLAITGSTPLYQFAKAVLRHHPEWEDGDKLQLLIGWQAPIEEVDEHGELLAHSPAHVLSFTIPIDTDARITLSDAIAMSTPAHVTFPMVNKNGMLAVHPAVMSSVTADSIVAFAAVHSRDSRRGLRVSSQQMCLSDTSMFDYFSSDEMLNRAMNMER